MTATQDTHLACPDSRELQCPVVTHFSSAWHTLAKFVKLPYHQRTLLIQNSE